MKRISNKYRVLPLLGVLCAISLSGCINVEEWDIDYFLNPDLSGRVVHHLTGVSFYAPSDDEDNLEKEQEQLDEVMEQVKVSLAKDIVTAFHMENVNINITNRRGNKFDMKLSGSFSDFIKSFAPLINASTYRIRRSKRCLVVKIKDIVPDETLENMEVTVHYSGRIGRNNAHLFNRESGSMTWNMKGTPETGLIFKLYLPRNEEE